MATPSSNNGSVNRTAADGSASGEQNVGFDEDNRIILKIISASETDLHLITNKMATIRRLKEIISRKLNLPEQISLLCRGRLLLEGTLSSNGIINNSTMLASSPEDTDSVVASSSEDTDSVQQINRPGEWNAWPNIIQSGGAILEFVNVQAPIGAQHTFEGPIRNFPTIVQSNRFAPYSFVTSAINCATQTAAVVPAIQQCQQYQNIQLSTTGRVGSMPVSNQLASQQGYPIFTLMPQTMAFNNFNAGLVQQTTPNNSNIRPNIVIEPIKASETEIHVVVDTGSNANSNLLPNSGANIPVNVDNGQSEPCTVQEMQQGNANLQAELSNTDCIRTIITKSPPPELAAHQN